MKKFLFFWVSLLIGSALFFWMVRVIGWTEIKDAFLAFTGLEGVVTLFLAFFVLLLGVLRWREILKTLGYNLPLRELLGPHLSCFAISYLFPMMVFGGDIFRGYVLKERNSVPLHKSVASAITDRILELTSCLILSYFGMGLFFSETGFLPQHLRVLVLGTFLVVAAFIAFFYLRSFKQKSIIKLFLKTNEDSHGRTVEKEVFKFFNPRNKFLYRALGLSFLKSFSAIIQYWIVVLFLGKTISFFWSLSIFGFSWLGMAFPISADLGSHDAVSVFLFRTLGIGSGTGAAFAMIVRGANIILSLIGIGFLFRLGFDFLRAVLFRKIERLFNNKIFNNRTYAI